MASVRFCTSSGPTKPLAEPEKNTHDEVNTELPPVSYSYTNIACNFINCFEVVRLFCYLLYPSGESRPAGLVSNVKLLKLYRNQINRIHP